MNYTFTTRTGDGANQVFDFSFAGQDRGYINSSNIVVTVDGTPVPFTLNQADPNKVHLTTAPQMGASVLIRRIMNKSIPYSDFKSGSAFGKDTLNNSFLQQLYVTQELLDGFAPDGFYLKQDLDMGNHRIVNLADPVDKKDAVNKEVTDILSDRVYNVETAMEGVANYTSPWSYDAVGGEETLSPPYKFKNAILFIDGLAVASRDFSIVNYIVFLPHALVPGQEVYMLIGSGIAPPDWANSLEAAQANINRLTIRSESAASTAEAQATIATTKATQASNSASGASSSATSALASREAAQQSASQAAASASTSVTSAAAAKESERLAALSATAAKASENASDGYARAAESSKNAAAVSATNSLNSEKAAKVSELNAKESADKLANLNDFAGTIQSVNADTKEVVFKGNINASGNLVTANYVHAGAGSLYLEYKDKTGRLLLDSFKNSSQASLVISRIGDEVGSKELMLVSDIRGVTTVEVTGNVRAYDYIVLSDARDKSDFVKYDKAVDKIVALTGYSYTINGARSGGVIAQDVKEVAPELVHNIKNKDKEDRIGVNYNGVVGILVEAVKELSAKVKSLEDKNGS